jgi:hypothetical protein
MPQLTTLNLNHFKMVEDKGLKIITSRSPWMALPPYQISWKCTKRLDSYWWGTDRHIHRQTDRQNGDLIRLLSFLERRLKSHRCDRNRRGEPICECKLGRVVVPWLRRLVADISPRRPGFVPGSIHVRFVVDKVALGQAFLRVLRFSPVNIIPPSLSPNSYHLGNA